MAQTPRRVRLAHRQSTQRGFILLPVVLAIALIATIAFLINTESTINVDMTANTTAAAEVEQVARAGLAHTTWGVQNSGCAGDMTMTTVPFGQGGTNSYTATVNTGGATTSQYTFIPDHDGFIEEGATDHNHAGDNTTKVLNKLGNTKHALYHYDLSSIPTSERVVTATAWFYVNSEDKEGTVTLHPVTAAWTEADLTWDLVGGKYDSTVYGSFPAQPVKDVWVSVNVTALAQSWVSNPAGNHGLLLNATSFEQESQYTSREHGTASLRPYLEVTTADAPVSPVQISATGTLAGNPSPANDITRTLTRGALPAYQPASNLVLQPDAATGEDAYIWEWMKTTNFGTDDETWVSLANNSTSRSLFTFNLAGVPAGAKILSATLSLHHESGNNVNVPITAHRISNPWNEAFVTWNLRDNGINWDTAGGDFDAAVISTTAVGPASDERYEWDITSLVQGWTDSTYPNYGVALATARNNSIGERFYTSDETTVTRRPRLTVQYTCECGRPCIAPQGSGTVLMVVINPTTLVPEDAGKKALFESWGYTVTVIGESENNTAYASAAAAADVVFISETVNVSQVGTKLANVPIGVVSQDGIYNDDLGIAGGSAWAVDTAINVTDTSHYITALFPAGPLAIYDAGMEQLTVSGTEAPGLQTLADTGGNGSLVVLDGGATGTGGTPIAGRRVMLPLGRDTRFNWDYLNSDGRLLVQRALQWGTGNVGIPEQKLLLVVGDATALASDDAERKALMEGWGYTVTFIDDGDTQVNFDTALAASDVAYVSSTVSDAALGTKLLNATIGVVNEKGEQVGELGIAGSILFKTRNEIDILDNSHYITQPFATGLLTFVSSDQPVHMLSSGVSSGFTTLAQSFNTGSQWKPSLGTLDAGDTLSGGGTAAGRRVQLPWGDVTFDPASLNIDGQTIMQRAIEWAESAGGTPPAQNVLLVVADPLSLTVQEAARKALIEGWGYAATLIDDDDIQANFDTALAAADVVYVSLEVSATSLGTKLVDAIIGVVSEHGDLIDDFGLASGSPTAVTLTDASIIDNTHYITDSFLPGGLTLASSSQPFTYVNAGVAAGVQTLADVFNKAALLVADTGAELLGSTSAPGRRVQLPWGSAGFDINTLNTDALKIMQRALEWAGAAPAPAYNVLLVVGNATTLASKDAGRKALMESWGYTVTVIDDGDSQANIDAAAAAADVVYVSGTVGGGTLADKLTGSATPIVNEFPGKLDNFGFCSTTNDTFSADTFNKSDAAHYITSPFAGASINVLTTFLSMPVPNGTLAPDLQVPADFATSERAVVTLDAGATRWDGNPAPARRAHLPFAPAETTQLTADGQTILQRTLEWAAGADSGGGGGGGPPAASPLFEEMTEAMLSSNGTSLAIDKPAGTAEGDLLVAVVATDGNNTASLAPPSGWNVIHVGDRINRVTLGVWWKLAGASESGSYTFDWSNGEQAYGWIMRFTGHDPISPVNATANNSGKFATPESPSVTTTLNNTLILRVGGFDGNQITAGDPGLPGHTAINMNDSKNDGSGDVSGGSGYVLQAAAGASGTSSFSLTGSEEYVTVTLAIAPAP